MEKHCFLLLAFALTSMTSCFWNNNKTEVASVINSNQIRNQAHSKDLPGSPGDVSSAGKNMALFARYFEKADAVHREAWWVLNAERKSVSKSPFGKVQRALLAAQNVKLSNKSLFRCDKYVVKRDILKVEGFPQKLEIFEKCSEKIGAKKIAEFVANSRNDISVTFFPENLEEILGLGATVLNTPISCDLHGNDKEQLVVLDCKNWFQERNKEQAIKLDVYNYQMEGRNVIKLRGKVYVNLSESRKIESDVPMAGKIFVKETELYPPEEEKIQTTVIEETNVVKKDTVQSIESQLGPQTYSLPQSANGITPLMTPHRNKTGAGNGVDPDIQLQLQKQQGMELEEQPLEQQQQEQLQEQPQEEPSPENPLPAEEQQSLTTPENHQETGETYGR